ncbi:TPA: SEC-C domain-containing protein [Citrobacter freundii]|nr:SEC-C domain-containing protein [Citrobacter freundii]
MKKIRRNQKCICGSKLKYKKCCFLKSKKRTNSSIILEARKISLEHNFSAIQKSIDIINPLINSGKLNKEDSINAKLGLVSAYQRQGRHKIAITVLEEMAELVEQDTDLQIYTFHQLASSYSALRYTDVACDMYKNIFAMWENNPANEEIERRIRGAILLEAGKAFSENGERQKAIDCWDKSAQILKDFEDEAEHIGRVQANIAFLMLQSEQEKDQEEGLKRVQISTTQKLKIGDLKGLANNYCNLGSYFLSKKRYGRALSNYRHDLYLSRLIGDKRDIASTIGNLASLYKELNQFKLAKKHILEARTIGEELDDEALIHISNKQFDQIKAKAKETAINKIATEEKAICPCGSNILYINCCGTADYEPINIPYIYDRFSEDALAVHEEMSSAKIQVSPLDFILRIIPKDKVRKSWSEHEVRDGWVIIKELPDMAAVHLVAAKEMLETSTEKNDLANSISAVILSVCHLEAFINQVSFFLYQNKDNNEVASMTIPQCLADDGAFDYQRKGNLEIKWQQIADCLTHPGWLSKQTSWQSAKDLIYIRNELVHFKAADYEQVVPPTKKKPSIYSKIPTSMTLRDGPHSWPFKIINADLAKWAVITAETLVEDLKKAYKYRRMNPLGDTV